MARGRAIPRASCVSLAGQTMGFAQRIAPLVKEPSAFAVRASRCGDTTIAARYPQDSWRSWNKGDWFSPGIIDARTPQWNYVTPAQIRRAQQLVLKGHLLVADMTALEFLSAPFGAIVSFFLLMEKRACGEATT